MRQTVLLIPTKNTKKETAQAADLGRIHYVGLDDVLDGGVEDKGEAPLHHREMTCDQSVHKRIAYIIGIFCIELLSPYPAVEGVIGACSVCEDEARGAIETTHYLALHVLDKPRKAHGSLRS